MFLSIKVLLLYASVFKYCIVLKDHDEKYTLFFFIYLRCLQQKDLNHLKLVAHHRRPEGGDRVTEEG